MDNAKLEIILSKLEQKDPVTATPSVRYAYARSVVEASDLKRHDQKKVLLMVGHGLSGIVDSGRWYFPGKDHHGYVASFWSPVPKLQPQPLTQLAQALQRAHA